MDKQLFKNITKEVHKIDKKTCLSLLKTMLRIRMTEAKIAELYPEQEIRCPTHLYMGQEAISSGVCQNLTTKDYCFSSYRSHGAYVAKGGSISKLFAELYGKRTGCSKGKGGSMHLVSKEVNFMGTSAMVAGVIPIAAGAGMAASMRGENRVSIVFFGDGACEQGVFFETLNLAALKKVPVIFVCENNFYATHTRQLTRQCLDNIYRRPGIYNIPAVRIDGNNVGQVYRQSKIFIENARKGKGPGLIECRTYRWLEHVGPYFDYELGYRSKKELDKWMNRCPIEIYEAVLIKSNITDLGTIDKMKACIKDEIEKGVVSAKTAPFPDYKEVWTDIYA